MKNVAHLVLACLAMLVISCGPAAADLVLQRAFVRDAVPPLALDAARAAAATPFDGVLHHGYGPEGVWLRLQLAPVPPEGGVLRIRPSYLDRIELFDPAAQPGDQRLTGDRQPLLAERYRSLNLNLPLRPSAEPREVWLHLRTTSSRIIEITALPPDAALRADTEQALALACYLALLLIFVLWAATNWALTREAVLGLFALRQVLALAFAVSSLGFLRFLGDDARLAALADQLTSLLVVALVGVSFLFEYRFMRLFHRRPLCLPLLVIGLGVAGIGTMLLGLGEVNAGLRVSVGAITLGAPWTLLLVAVAPSHTEEGKPAPLPRRLLAGGYLTINLLVMLSLLPLLGVPFPAGVDLAMFQLQTLCSGLVLMSMLHLRMARQRGDAAQTAARLLLAEQAVAQAQHRREEQNRFLSMLTHELRTPMAVIALEASGPGLAAEAKAIIGRCIADMRSIIDRCVQMARLDDGAEAVARVPCELGQELARARAECGAPDRVALALGTPLPLATDIGILRVILANLLDNALKYGDRTAPVELSADAACHQGRGGVEVRVANRPGAAGWPDRQRLFGKYYRAPRAAQVSGSGLGLYIVHGLARLLGCVVRYEPEGAMVRFVLWLPA